MDRRRAVSLLVCAVAAGACRRGPRALRTGIDSCAQCRMTIDDARFGALALTARGKILTFDSIECLAAYVAALPLSEQLRGTWVADFEQPATWVEAVDARYLVGSTLRSPMGRDLTAFASGSDATDLTRRYGGRAIGWSEVLTLAARPVRSSVSTLPASPAAHAH